MEGNHKLYNSENARDEGGAAATAVAAAAVDERKGKERKGKERKKKEKWRRKNGGVGHPPPTKRAQAYGWIYWGKENKTEEETET